MIDIDISKYEDSVIKNLNKDNINRIIAFLLSKGCDYVEELLEDYLDIFRLIRGARFGRIRANNQKRRKQCLFLANWSRC